MNVTKWAHRSNKNNPMTDEMATIWAKNQTLGARPEKTGWNCWSRVEY
jgi:hypothetical protein